MEFLANTNRAVRRVLPLRLSFCGLPGVPLHDRPENCSFSAILCQRFNSRIAAVKLRFLERFETFARSISAPSSLVQQFEANTCSARRIAARPSHPTKEGWPPDRPLTFCWGLLPSRSGQLLTRAGKHTACRSLKQAHAR